MARKIFKKLILSAALGLPLLAAGAASANGTGRGHAAPQFQTVHHYSYGERQYIPLRRLMRLLHARSYHDRRPYGWRHRHWHRRHWEHRPRHWEHRPRHWHHNRGADRRRDRRSRH